MCSYCYMPNLNVQPEHQVIDLNFAKAGIDHFFSTNSSRGIRFFASGEATQAFYRMVEILDYAKYQGGDKLTVELQTNGCFSDIVAEWVEENINVLWISCDGPSEFQDHQRPMRNGYASNPTVLRNIKRFAKNQKIQFGIRSTVSEENLNRQVELVKYFNSLGIRYLCVAPTYNSTVKPDVVTPPLLVFAKNFIPAFDCARQHGMFYQTHLIVNFDEEVESYCRACTPCPHLTTDGFISCCDWASFGPQYLPGSLQELIYGHYDFTDRKLIIDESKMNRIKMRNTSNLSKADFKGCFALKHCAGGCIGKMIVATGNLYKATSEWCLAVKFLLKNLKLEPGLFPVLHS